MNLMDKGLRLSRTMQGNTCRLHQCTPQRAPTRQCSMNLRGTGHQHWPRSQGHSTIQERASSTTQQAPTRQYRTNQLGMSLQRPPHSQVRSTTQELALNTEQLARALQHRMIPLDTVRMQHHTVRRSVRCQGSTRTTPGVP